MTPNGARGRVLIRGASVLSMDPAVGELERGDVLIDGGTIRAVAEHVPCEDADEVIDGTGRVALPGIVDSHWHLWGTLLRGVTGDGPERGWFAIKTALGAHLTPEDNYLGVRLAAAEGLAAGITTMHDWAHNLRGGADVDATLQAHRDLGIRVFFSYGTPNAHPALSFGAISRAASAAGNTAVDAPMDFADVARAQQQWVPTSDGLLQMGVALRGPARSTIAVCHEEWARARELGMMISMHCAGTRGEVERIRQVEIMEADGLLGPDLLLAHCIYLADHEVALLAEHGIAVTVSPLSEMRLAMGLPRILDFADRGVPVSLSLDTTAIAGGADPFQAARVAVGVENARRGDAQALDPRHALRLMTIEGARALGLGDVTGSLTPGKRADVILVDTRTANMAPGVDPAVAIVHSAQPSNVDTVIVDGRVRKRAGRLVDVDLDALVDQSEAALRALCARAGAQHLLAWAGRE